MWRGWKRIKVDLITYLNSNFYFLSDIDGMTNNGSLKDVVFDGSNAELFEDRDDDRFGMNGKSWRHIDENMKWWRKFDERFKRGSVIGVGTHWLG